MPKVSNECMDMIKELPEADLDDLKEACLIAPKQTRKPSAYSLHMSKCLKERSKNRTSDIWKEEFQGCVDEYNENKGG